MNEIVPIYVLGIVSLLVVMLGGFVLTQQWRYRAGLAFSTTMFGVAGWAGGIALFLNTHDVANAHRAASLYYIAATVIAAAVLYLSLGFAYDTHLLKVRHQRLLDTLLILPPLIISLLFIVCPSFFFGQFHLGQNPHTIDLKAGGYALFVCFFLLYYLTATSLLVIAALKSRGRTRLRLGLVSLAYIIAGIVGMAFNLILPALGNYNWIWIGPLGLFVFIPLLYVAILRLGLFDIRGATARTVAYGLTLALLLVVYYIVINAIAVIFLSGDLTHINFVYASLALLLAIIFHPIKRFFDRMTNFLFYRDAYDMEEFLSRFTRRLSKITDIHTLLSYSATEIAKTLKANFGSFLVWRENAAPYFVSTTPKRHTLPSEDVEEITKYVSLPGHDYILTSTLEEERALRRILVSHRIEVVLPIRQGRQVIAYLFLGDHLSSYYNTADILLLQTISAELAIAIENALSVQEVRDLNDTLQQRINGATAELRHSNAQLQQLDAAKDEFISMASHQLRTPLTTIKGYISMVIEGDAGKITPEQKRLLSEAFTSSERMVRLISDFLNVSRLQTGKFIIEKQPSNLAKVVSEELESLSPNASARGIRFIYKEPKNFPTLYLDETKIRQVIMNFSDNALYYSGKGKTVDINLKLEKGEVIFTVKDHGIGVPKEQQAHLFQKFFRATNARSERPDGTGVGLFLAKRVIDDHHGGLIFESTEGKGSTFGFRLPLSEVQVPDTLGNQKPLA